MSVEAPIQGLLRSGGQHTLVVGSISSNSSIFGAVGNNIGSLSSATESQIQLTIDNSIRIRRFRFIASANSKDASTVINYRVDSATATGATLTYTAGQTGAKDSGALNVIVNSGSKVCWNFDSSASSSGSISGWGWMEYEVLS